VLLISQKEDGYQLEAYLDYLRRMQMRLPEGARSFVLAPWHYDFTHRKCPHDSWLETVALRELSRSSRNEIRRLEISATFLGAFHDGVFDIVYRDVQSYSLVWPDGKDRRATVAHGDWIVDEVLLTQEGSISHEIVFSERGVWKIVCGDLFHQWRDTAHSGD
jgi:hypothetical protein